jgi:isocitrate lyase
LEENPRWTGIKRPYTAEDVLKLRGKVIVEHSLARLGANKLWRRLNNQPYVAALGALTGNQAIQEVAAGLEAIYLSGWQVAADAISLVKCIQINLSIQSIAFLLL